MVLLLPLPLAGRVVIVNPSDVNIYCSKVQRLLCRRSQSVNTWITLDFSEYKKCVYLFGMYSPPLLFVMYTVVESLPCGAEI